MDTMEEQWGCSNCYHKFKFKDLKCIDGANQFGLGCPQCKSGMHLFKPNYETVIVSEYHGEKGTVQ